METILHEINAKLATINGIKYAGIEQGQMDKKPFVIKMPCVLTSMETNPAALLGGDTLHDATINVKLVMPENSDTKTLTDEIFKNLNGFTSKIRTALLGVKIEHSHNDGYEIVILYFATNFILKCKKLNTFKSNVKIKIKC